MAYISTILTSVIGAVKKSAIPLTRDFNELEHLQTSHNDGMFASRSAEKVTNLLREELTKIKPDYAVVNAGDKIPSGSYFLVSAIDGYANFAHGNANFAISVAIVENDEVTHAVVYNPIFDEMFFAEKGCGAFKEGFRNHERIRVSACKVANRSLIATNANLEVFTNALKISNNVTIKGSVALDLAYVASGKLDIAIASHNHPAKIAAGILLVKEAGGYIFSIGDEDVRSENLTKALFGGDIFATNDALRKKVAETLVK